MSEKTVITQPLLVLCGPTAVGKTELSLQIAERFSCEIVGVDSMQVYRHMDIGTAKPTLAERKRVPHHLIDMVDPDEDYSMGRFIKDAETAIRLIRANNNVPLLTGGTGLYFRGLLEGAFAEDGHDPESSTDIDDDNKEKVRQDLRYRLEKEGSEALYAELAEHDPESAQRIHPNDSYRVTRGLEIYYTTGITWSGHLANQSRKEKKYHALKIGLTRPRPELYQRIDQRVNAMIEQGLLGEVKKLLAMGYARELKSMQSIGYRHMINYIDENWSWVQALEFLGRDTRHYAKRQFTWFNNDQEITWHDVNDSSRIMQDIELFLSEKSL